MNETENQYINAVNYKDWQTKLTNLKSLMEDARALNTTERRLRYAEINIEDERAAGRIAPDELYIPQHIIDSNIRREQSSYVQYIVQSPRAIILEDVENPVLETSAIEKDATSRIRYDGWQIPMFSNIDGMQQSGYGVMEIIYDKNKAGSLRHEYIQKCDFGLVTDTKNIQEAELVGRNYYFSKTTLLTKGIQLEELGGFGFNPEQVSKITDGNPSTVDASTAGDSKDKSLFCIQKVMFRVNGVVVVAWTSKERCDDWVRAPRPLFIGRKKLAVDPVSGQPVMDPLTGIPVSQDDTESEYPFYLFPYLISENDTISQLKGRVFLDQDTQQAVSSLLSSTCTAHRRASGLYFSKDVEDPNSDVLTQKNVYFKTGALINGKVQQFQLNAPGAEMLGAIQALVTSNQSQTSQINFAAMNRQDSRKTATEVNAAQEESQSLSTVQVVLFSNSLRNLYDSMFRIIQSRVLAGLIQVEPPLVELYKRTYHVKPSGDVDVIERQKTVQMMLQMWQIMAQTPAAVPFLADMLTKMFPDNAPKYLNIFAQAQQAQQQGQQQMMQAIGADIVALAQHPEMFTPEGQQKALPAIQQAAALIGNGQNNNQPTQGQNGQ